jgi:hypothetical protein
MRTGRVFILHTINPRMLLEAVMIGDFSDTSHDSVYKLFHYQNTDGIDEDWCLVLRDTYDDANQEELIHVIDRAWKWYRSYLNWEDDNIDDEEDAKWN